MKPLAAFLALLVLTSVPDNAHAASAPGPLSNKSLVRVNSTNQAFDFFRPWMKKAPFLRKGLGVVLSGDRVLVTAEIVANHNYVELERAASAEKTPAEVVVVDYDCNLALLKPLDPNFLKDAKSLELDSGAGVGDKASVVQLESNGIIAETPATITTIAVTGYPLDHLSLLIYRLSVPLQNREGSFTIPAVRDGKLLGLMMRYDSRTQTAELIPPAVISHFLTDAKLAQYPGFARVGVAFSSTRDPQFRRYIGLKENGGVYVTEVRPGGAADKAGLKKGDVILSVAGKPIDQDGNYADPNFGNISYSNLISTEAHVGDTLDFVILRDGKKQTLPVKLESLDHSQVVSEPYLYNQPPRYYILGGLVFQELSRPYLQEWGANWQKIAPQRLVYLDAFQGEEQDPGSKIVFLSQVLPTPSTLGYENLEHLVVTKVNGVEIKSLADLAKAAKTPKDGFHKVEFEQDPGFIYLDSAEVENGKSQIIDEYNIPVLQNLD